MLLLILRLEAPLMRWGIHSLWNERDTHIVPTKSAIVGLLSSALGLSRGDMQIEELSRKIKIGVREDRKGIPLRDLQIVSSNSNHRIQRLCKANYKHRAGNESSLLTYRHYLQDASFTVVISAESTFLEKIAVAIQKPIFPIFLGAKSCVASRPIFESLSKEYISIEDALDRYPIASLVEKKNNKQQRYYCEVEDEQGKHVRQDEIKINEMREYGFRRISIRFIGG